MEAVVSPLGTFQSGGGACGGKHSVWKWRCRTARTTSEVQLALLPWWLHNFRKSLCIQFYYFTPQLEYSSLISTVCLRTVMTHGCAVPILSLLQRPLRNRRKYTQFVGSALRRLFNIFVLARRSLSTKIAVLKFYHKRTQRNAKVFLEVALKVGRLPYVTGEIGKIT